MRWNVILCRFCWKLPIIFLKMTYLLTISMTYLSLADQLRYKATFQSVGSAYNGTRLIRVCMYCPELASVHRFLWKQCDRRGGEYLVAYIDENKLSENEAAPKALNTRELPPFWITCPVSAVPARFLMSVSRTAAAQTNGTVSMPWSENFTGGGEFNNETRLITKYIHMACAATEGNVSPSLFLFLFLLLNLIPLTFSFLAPDPFLLFLYSHPLSQKRPISLRFL